MICTLILLIILLKIKINLPDYIAHLSPTVPLRLNRVIEKA